MTLMRIVMVEDIQKAQQEASDAICKIMQGPIDHYNSARHPDEIDLVAEVRQRLVDVGLKDRLPFTFDNNRFIIEAQGRTAHAQQYNLNRYLSTQLMSVPEDTSVERYALVYEIRPDHWLTIFEKTILPSFVNYNLPVAV